MGNLSSVMHKRVEVVIAIENGQVIHIQRVRDNEIIASMDTFIHMAKQHGFTVIPPARGEDNGSDSDTDS